MGRAPALPEAPGRLPSPPPRQDRLLRARIVLQPACRSNECDCLKVQCGRSAARRRILQARGGRGVSMGWDSAARPDPAQGTQDGCGRISPDSGEDVRVPVAGAKRLHSGPSWSIARRTLDASRLPFGPPAAKPHLSPSSLSNFPDALSPSPRTTSPTQPTPPLSHLGGLRFDGVHRQTLALARPVVDARCEGALSLRSRRHRLAWRAGRRSVSDPPDGAAGGTAGSEHSNHLVEHHQLAPWPRPPQAASSLLRALSSAPRAQSAAVPPSMGTSRHASSAARASPADATASTRPPC
eukprot:scaffold1046_cov118-Isochrysis_galbana.AAC.8